MSKSYYLSANISPTYDTFASWLTKTNTILYDMGTYVVTTDTSAAGGSTTGNAYVNGFFSANTLIAQDALRGGSITSNGVLNIISNTVVNNSILTVGNSSFYTQIGYIGTSLSSQYNIGTTNARMKIIMANANSGTSATSGYTVYNDVGYASQNMFLDMGINSSGFSSGTWTISGPSDSYVYSGNSNLSVGTANNNYINFFTNGTLAASEKMRISANGNVGIGNTAPDAKLRVEGTANIIGNTYHGGNINVAGTGYFSGNVSVIGTFSTSGALGLSSITGSTPNTFLKINGSNAVSFATIALGDLSNVTGVGSPTSGYVLAWNGSAWTATNPSGISTAINSNTIIIANTEQTGGNSSIGYQWQITGNTTTGSITANSANIIFQTSANVQIIGSANVTGNLYASVVGSVIGNVTGNANTSTKWFAPVNVTVAGDVVNSSATTLDGSANITINTILSNTGVTSGSYGNSSAYPVITVDSKGRVTSIANQVAVGAVSSFNSRTGAITLTSADVNTAISNTTITQPIFKSYREYQAVSSGVTGATNLDLSTSNIFQLTLSGATTITFTNPPTSAQIFSFTVIVIQDATGGRTIAWPTGTKYSGGVVPPSTTTANAVDVWSFMTYNGGTTYIASLSVKNAA